MGKNSVYWVGGLLYATSGLVCAPDSLFGNALGSLRIDDDLRNVLTRIDLGVIFLGSKLHFRLFNESAAHSAKLIDSYIGRPPGDIATNLRYDRLVEDARDALKTLDTKEVEVEGTGCSWSSVAGFGCTLDHAGCESGVTAAVHAREHALQQVGIEIRQLRLSDPHAPLILLVFKDKPIDE